MLKRSALAENVNVREIGRREIIKLAMQMGKVLTMVRAIVAKDAGVLKELALKIHAHPELGYEEKKACAWQASLLKRWRFKVTMPWAGMSTAYRATSGAGKPVFCFMSEYDALPQIGHGCGHNLICAAALGAAHALSRVLKHFRIEGSVMVLGVPAEESFGGKVKLLANNGLRGVDAVIMAHPSYRTTPDSGCSAIKRYRIHFKGKSAHAAASPESGRNALDAVMLLFQGVNAWRQQLPESSRIHGIVSDGGVMPNIIPDTAGCVFYLRSPDDGELLSMTRRFEQIVSGAALMTATEARMEPWLTPYKARWPNATLNRLFVESAEMCGLRPEIPERPGRASTDFGDVSQQVPGAHVNFGISRKYIAGHSIAFREAAGSSYAVNQMLKTAQSMALVGYRFCADQTLRRQAALDFASDKRSRT